MMLKDSMMKMKGHIVVVDSVMTSIIKIIEKNQTIIATVQGQLKILVAILVLFFALILIHINCMTEYVVQMIGF